MPNLKLTAGAPLQRQDVQPLQIFHALRLRDLPLVPLLSPLTVHQKAQVP